MKDWPSPDDDERGGWALDIEFAFVAAFIAGGILLAVYSLISSVPASAHPGGLAADGCHADRRNGGRHCHGGAASHGGQRGAQRFTRPRAGAYANCSEVRAAGAAPVRGGARGYGAHLDRDGDGIGCE